MRQKIGTALAGALFLAVLAGSAASADQVVKIQQAMPEGVGESLGTVTIASSGAGATFKLDLHGLPPGQHGFHVHENDTCEPALVNGNHVAAGGAGGHLDPGHTGKHTGPDGEGHLGDLPALNVAADGTATQTLTAPRIKSIDTLKGHALMIHAGGDNYGDSPTPLGGGGGRFACGVIE